MEGGFVAQLFFCSLDHAFMVEDEFGHFINEDPFRMVVVAKLFLVLMNIYKSEVGDAKGTFYGVAIRFAEGAELLHVDAFEPRKFFQDAVGGLFETFFRLEEAAHQTPFAFLRFESALDDQEFYVCTVETEDDAVNGDQHAGFACVSIHINLIKYIFIHRYCGRKIRDLPEFYIKAC